jgi:hypothetical protein
MAFDNSAPPDVELDPFGAIAWLGERFDEARDLLRMHASSIRDLMAENQRLRDRIVTLEAGRGVNGRDDDQLGGDVPKPQLH